MRARASTKADVEDIARVCAAGYRRTYAGLLSAAAIEDVVTRFYGAERIHREVASALPGWSGYLVVEDERGLVVAAGGGGLTRPGVAEVYVLYVDPERRGQGFGSAVLGLLTAQQVDVGATEQWVSVQMGNTLGIPFYEARGFAFVEEVEPWDPVLVAEGARTWRMRRRITDPES